MVTAMHGSSRCGELGENLGGVDTSENGLLLNIVALLHTYLSEASRLFGCNVDPLHFDSAICSG